MRLCRRALPGVERSCLGERDGKIRRKDLPEKVVARMTLDLCERGGERSKSSAGASTLRSGSPATTAPLAAAAEQPCRSPNSRRWSSRVSGGDQG